MAAGADASKPQYGLLDGYATPIERASAEGYHPIVGLLRKEKGNQWRQRVLKAAGRLAATAGMRVQRLSKIKGLRTEAATPTAIDYASSTSCAALVSLRRSLAFACTLLVAVVTSLYHLLASLLTRLLRPIMAIIEFVRPGTFGPPDGPHIEEVVDRASRASSAGATFPARAPAPAPPVRLPIAPKPAAGKDVAKSPAMARAAAGASCTCSGEVLRQTSARGGLPLSSTRGAIMGAARAAARGVASALSNRSPPASQAGAGGFTKLKEVQEDAADATDVERGPPATAEPVTAESGARAASPTVAEPASPPPTVMASTAASTGAAVYGLLPPVTPAPPPASASAAGDSEDAAAKTFGSAGTPESVPPTPADVADAGTPAAEAAAPAAAATAAAPADASLVA